MRSAGNRRVGPDALVLFALLTLLAVLSVYITTQSRPSGEGFRPRRTIHSAKPGGWKALSLLLREQGLTVQETRRAPRAWPKSVAVMVTGEPYRELSLSGGAAAPPWDEKQTTDALNWVSDGGTLLLLSGLETELTKKLGLEVEQHLHADAVLAPVQPAPFFTGVRGVLLPGAERWTKTPVEAAPLLADDRPAVVALRRGRGTIIAVASAALADNRNLARNNNARFLVQTIARYAVEGGGSVAFDEYHQGYQESDTLWTAIGQPGQLAAWHLAALALLIAYSMGRRFGLPRPVPAPPRVSSEYVASLADLYRRANARDAALEGVYLPFWRDLCRTTGMPLDAPTAEVTRRVAVTLGGGAATASDSGLESRLNRLTATCEAKIDGGAKALSEYELLTLSREIEEMRKELGLGRDD